MSVYDKVKANGVSDVVVLEKDLIPDHVMRVKRRGDIILVLGAGDIKTVADRLSGMIGKDPGAPKSYLQDDKLIAELLPTQLQLKKL